MSETDTFNRPLAHCLIRKHDPCEHIVRAECTICQTITPIKCGRCSRCDPHTDQIMLTGQWACRGACTAFQRMAAYQSKGEVPKV